MYGVCRGAECRRGDIGGNDVRSELCMLIFWIVDRPRDDHALLEIERASGFPLACIGDGSHGYPRD